MRPSVCCVSSTAEILRSRMAAAAARAEPKSGSNSVFIGRTKSGQARQRIASFHLEDDFFQTIWRQDGSSQRAEFRDQFRPGQRVFRIAFGMADHFFEAAAVFKVDDGDRGPFLGEGFLYFGTLGHDNFVHETVYVSRLQPRCRELL